MEGDPVKLQLRQTIESIGYKISDNVLSELINNTSIKESNSISIYCDSIAAPRSKTMTYAILLQCVLFEHVLRVLTGEHINVFYLNHMAPKIKVFDYSHCICLKKKNEDMLTCNSMRKLAMLFLSDDIEAVKTDDPGQSLGTLSQHKMKWCYSALHNIPIRNDLGFLYIDSLNG
eukprot:501698_1